MTRFWLSIPLVVMMSMLVLLPIWGTFMPNVEGKLMPVTSTWQITPTATQPDEGLSFMMTFKKHRACEIIDYSWISNTTNVRANVEVKQEYTVATLPTGEHVTGPWVADIDRLEDYHAVVIHRCHFLWLTVSNVYP